MTETETEFSDAERKSREARARLTATLVEIQSRINPRALARDAVDEIRAIGADAVRAGITVAKRNPGSIMAIGATLIALFARGWIADAIAPKHAATDATTQRLAAEQRSSEKGTTDD